MKELIRCGGQLFCFLHVLAGAVLSDHLVTLKVDLHLAVDGFLEVDPE